MINSVPESTGLDFIRVEDRNVKASIQSPNTCTASRFGKTREKINAYSSVLEVMDTRAPPLKTYRYAVQTTGRASMVFRALLVYHSASWEPKQRSRNQYPGLLVGHSRNGEKHA
jgi:hypothetical protein